MLELFPEGFEERDAGDDVELVAYTNAGGEERVSLAFGAAQAAEVEDVWEVSWRSFHRPVRIGPLWIGPPWLEPAAGSVAVVIDPGRAFGTGAHATTRLCVELLLDVAHGSLLDVGCGSGVVSVAAAKLGFAPVTAVDHDPSAIDATRRNGQRNGTELTILLADADEEALPESEIAVVNISLEAVERLVPRLGARTAVTAGYLESCRPEPAGYRHLARVAAEGWAADHFERE